MLHGLLQPTMSTWGTWALHQGPRPHPQVSTPTGQQRQPPTTHTHVCTRTHTPSRLSSLFSHRHSFTHRSGYFGEGAAVFSAVFLSEEVHSNICHFFFICEIKSKVTYYEISIILHKKASLYCFSMKIFIKKSRPLSHASAAQIAEEGCFDVTVREKKLI